MAIDISRLTMPDDNEILGVEFKFLNTHGDARGFFREVIRSTDPIFTNGNFAQWSHSKMTKNVVKAWHYHHLQYDWWYLAVGQVLTVLFDNRKDSPTYKKKLEFKIGDPTIYGDDTLPVTVKIPPGVLHGLKVLSEEAHLMYITSERYNPNDEGRFPYNSDVVPHDWGSNVITAENDRKTFVPTATLKPIK